MAHKKGVGSTDNGRDSNSKRLGVKLYGGELAIAGNIIIRQRGTKFHAGNNVGMGKDHTLYALTDGVVMFRKKRKNRTFVSIAPMEVERIDEDGIKDKVPAKDIENGEPKPKKAPKAAKKAKPEPVQPKEKPAKKVEKKTKAKSTKEEPADEQSASKELLDSIGTASKDEKDDLKKIKGIGPKLEETLNNIGIYTFEQVAKMKDKEYDLVDSLMDSFKGRGKRDDWAGQAKELKG